MSLPFLLMLAAMAPKPNPMLVDRAWLAERLQDPKLVMLQIGDRQSKADYDAGHIPGSQFVAFGQELAAPMDHSDPSKLMLELPSPTQLKSTLEAKGIGDDSYVVLIVAREYFSPTTRAYLTLTYAGLGGRISILDGGVEAWKKDGRPMTADLPTIRPGSLTLRLDSSVVVSAEQVHQSRGKAGVVVVDARDTAFFNGADTHQARSGRIPGAISIPYSSFFTDDGFFKSAAAIEAIFTAAGVKKGDRVLSYCHIGQQATAVWFAARLLGHEASLYDGSFDEWSRRKELPVDAGKSP